MKGLKTLTAVLLGVALLATAAPASAKAAAFRHYVACGSSQNAKPSHSCPAGSKKGAFFKSTKADLVYYTVCVKFPNGKHPCVSHQKAKKGTLYVNNITSNVLGKHEVSWFVGKKRVGFFVFNVVGKH
ncbi:MAG TPA: hypothetical protein VII45_02885 [Solirubrobacterales bacterium]